MKPYSTRSYKTTSWYVFGQPDTVADVLHKFRSLVGGGGNKGDFVSPTPFAYDITQFEYYAGTRRSTFDGAVTRLTTGVLDQGAVYSKPPTGLDSVVNAVYNNCLNKLREQVQGQLNLAVTLAESGQTRKMLALTTRAVAALTRMKKSYMRDVANKIRSWKDRRRLRKYLTRWQRGIKHTRDGKIWYRPIRVDDSYVSSVSRLGANGWLEFTYGWSPLFQDIYGLAQASLGNLYNQLTHFKVRSRQQGHEKYEMSSDQGAQIRGDISYDVKTTLGISLSSSFDAGASRFTSMNPLGVVYELLPYSFVLDWFYDLGSYMANVEAAVLHGASFRRGYVSRVVHYNTKSQGFKNRSGRAGNSWWTEYEFGQSSFLKTTFSRTKLNGWPIPQAPTCKADLGSSRLLSAAALLRQLPDKLR